MIRVAAAVAVVTALVAGCGADRVIVGAGTTTVDSGLMSALEDQYGRALTVVAGSTAELLRLAEQGAVDAVIVHDVAQELAFLAAHPAAQRAPAFASRFLIVGPPPLVATIPTSSAAAAFAAIAAAGHTFVTRDDASGTHAAERAIWAASGVEPTGDWYVATGQGMGLTLQVADQLGGFTLVEEGVFVGAADTIGLEVVQLPPEPLLVNRYSVIKVAPAADQFFAWLTGPEGRAGIAAADAATFSTPVYVASNES